MLESLQGKKILIAEDDSFMMDAYQEYFSRNKETKIATMLYAKNPKECIEILDNQKPHLMFLDLGLDDTQPPPGFKILKDYKSKLKIIIISGYLEHKDQCLSDGAIEFLGKPIQSKHLIELMKKYA